MPKVVGIKFKSTAKTYYFDPGDKVFELNKGVIVETARGVEYGKVVMLPTEVSEDKIVSPLKPVIRIANEDDEKQGMGTTVVVATIIDHKMHVANVGDSRLYVSKGRGNGDKLFQITKDHSLVQELFEQGRITAAEAQSHPYKNYILRALGIEDELSFDYFIVDDGFDTVLLCSDGLTNFVSETELLKTLSSAMSAGEKVEFLVDRANENGGGDNITAVVMQ